MNLGPIRSVCERSNRCCVLRTLIFLIDHAYRAEALWHSETSGSRILEFDCRCLKPLTVRRRPPVICAVGAVNLLSASRLRRPKAAAIEAQDNTKMPSDLLSKSSFDHVSAQSFQERPNKPDNIFRSRLLPIPKHPFRATPRDTNVIDRSSRSLKQIKWSRRCQLLQIRIA